MVSTTDPESGMFHKRDRKRCFAYETYTVCDRHNFILDTVVTSRNVHGSVAFDMLYERVVKQLPEIKTIAMDAGYKTPMYKMYIRASSSARNTKVCQTVPLTGTVTGNIIA